MQQFRLDAVPGDWSEFLSAGRSITAIAHDSEAYYHHKANFLFDDGTILSAVADEHCLARLFDCYTLSLQICDDMPDGYVSLSPVFEIDDSFALVRDEWLAPAPELEDKTVGRNPHIHGSGLPDSAPTAATVLATCLAGVVIISRDGRKLAILTADDVPLNIDISMDSEDVDGLVKLYEFRSFAARARGLKS